MQFGPVPISEAAGAVLAHSVRAGEIRLRKGHALSVQDCDRLAAAGLSQVIVARAEPGDLGEDEAAHALAQAFAGKEITAGPAATGRVNLHASAAGLFRAERTLVDALNAVDPAITYACLEDRSPVAAGDMVATIKIIPLAVPGDKVREAATCIARAGLSDVLPFRAMRVGLAATELPSLKTSVMDKTRRLTQARLAPSGSVLTREIRTAHEAGALASALRELVRDNDLVIIFGASAVTDPRDVIPEAIRLAGGTVERVGMPVDPGNLLVVGSVGDIPVIGAPGCARSPRENGFDWVLNRILAGESVTSTDIAGMGVGGLLKEIATRPQPREGISGEGPVEAVLLAAGRASRMGDVAGHKLLARFDGKPLVRHATETLLAAPVSRVVAVTGYRAGDIGGALDGCTVAVIHNPDWESGMASSLKAGLAALSADASGALIMLADMPRVTADDLSALLAAFHANKGQAIIRASAGGKRGNPVILPRAAFSQLSGISGDAGARALIESGAFAVVDVDIGPAAAIDVDTVEALRSAGGVPEHDQGPD